MITPYLSGSYFFAINYLKRGLIMSDKSDSLIKYDLLQPIFDATCCLINSFCHECEIDVQWQIDI